MAESNRVPSELDVVRRQAEEAWDWFEEAVHDVGAETANWWPPGTANSIGATYLHVVINTDVELNRLLLGEQPLVEGPWDGDVGQNVPYDPERFDRWDRHVEIDWERLRDYGRAVHGLVVETFSRLTPQLLDQPVDMTRAGLGMWQGRDLLELHGAKHVHMHGGEIACLKGLQGGVGWRESEAFRAAVIVEDHRPVTSVRLTTRTAVKRPGV